MTGFERRRESRGSLLVLATLAVVTAAAGLGACSRTGLWLDGVPFAPGDLSPDSGARGPDGALEDDASDAATLDETTPDGSRILPDASISYGLLFFGGREALGLVPSDTWIWFDGGWSSPDAATAPRGRYNHSMSSWRGGVLLYGGIAEEDGRNQLTDTWYWDGAAWTQMSSDGPLSNDSPIPMAELNGVVVAYVLNTGDGDSTWVWDGAWSLKTTVGPPKSQAGVMGTVGDQIIWIGEGETWAWDGTAWTQLPEPAPVGVPDTTSTYVASTPSGLLCMTPSPSVATLNGTAFAGTAVWNGSWSSLSAPAPGPLENPSMGATPIQAIAFGGDVPGSKATKPLGDTWGWDGGSWTVLDASGPSARSSGAMAAFPYPPGQ